MKYINKLHKICKDNLELIENYDKAVKDDFKGWVLHHRLELTIDGEEVHTPESLIRLNMYYHRPYFELIFLKRGEHIALHNKGKKGKFTEERCRKISEAVNKAFKDKKASGETIIPWNKGKRLSEEHRINVSKSLKGRVPWNKGKHLSEDTRKKLSYSLKGRISPMKGKTISEDTRKKLSEAHKCKCLSSNN